MTSNDGKESSVLLDLTKQLKLDSESGIISCLTRIKNDSKCYKQFSKDGGLGILVNLLRYKNTEILNTSLSILANACIAPDAREKVRETKIGPYVIRILKNIKLSNTLHCRACRLIGNLSECSWHARSLCDIGVILVLSTLLQTETSVQTYSMTVRAVRNIWSIYEGSREEILETGVIKNITALLITATQKAAESESKYLKLVEVCLKAMCAFLVTLDPRCAEQMRGEKDAEGYKCIVQCCSMKNKMAFTCLYNLCQIAECRPVLGNSGAIENLITLIDEHSELSKEVLDSLCLFCREAVNRARVRIGTGLELMLTILKNTENERHHPMLLHALAQFIYDDPSIAIMIKHGLLDILVEKLKKMVDEALVNNANENNVSKKRCNDSPPNRKTGYKYNRTNISRFSLDYHPDDWSPGSVTSVSSSPPSTPPLPFYDSAIFDENAEDNYSPVCSDTEWGDNDEGPQEEAESVKSCKSLTTDVEGSQNDNTGKPLKTSVYECTGEWILMLLSRLSHSNEPIERLADPTTIVPLSAYIRHAKNLRASRILIRIVRNRAYLIPLVKQGFVFEAQTLYDSELYTRQLCALAETGGAVGELQSILLRGEEYYKLVIAVSIPFLIKSQFILKSLLNTYGGLELIFRVLMDQEHCLYENAIWSICLLANTLQIRPDVVDKCQRIDSGSVECLNIYENLSKPATVTFELDDGTTVDACRQTLCQRSDAFLAMLEGNFSESGKRRVRLKNTTKEGLNTLLLAVNGVGFQDHAIESLLDAVLLADKFLMADISDILTESSISKLNYENFSRAWNWARSNSCHELKSCCLKTFLTAKMTKTERVKAFRDFSNNDSFHEFLGEIKEILNGVLYQR